MNEVTARRGRPRRRMPGTSTSRGPGGEEIGDVEATCSAEHRRHALVEQQSLNELGLGLVTRGGDLDEVALRQLGLDCLLRACVRFWTPAHADDTTTCLTSAM